MNSDQLISRNKQFVLSVIQLVRSLPKSNEAQIMGKQLLRSATSTAANYRAACRSRSKAEFLAKLSIVVEEIDESNFWIDLLIDSKITNGQEAKNLLNESLELIKIYSSSRKSARSSMD